MELANLVGVLAGGGGGSRLLPAFCKVSNGRGHYLAVFNRSESAQKFALEWNEVGLVSHKAYKLRDLWEHKELGSASSLEVSLQPHACALYRASE